VHFAAAFLLFLAITASYDHVQAETALPPAASQPVEFQHQVLPLFEKHCVKCHGPEKQKGDLRLDVKSMALRGGADGAVIVPGKGGESRLVVAVSGVDEDLIMPPKGERLSAAEVGVLRRWIDDGAVWPDNAGAADPALTHWSFRDLHRPKVPATDYSNPVDAFIAAKLAEKQLALSPPADARTLVRRMNFDVLGLPPTPEEADAFEVEFAKDPKGALSALADRLLASPHYGERWARHWLDVVRFAESDGFETNQPRANAWPYRDYVIRAFNSDKPYDQFVREQIAGDACGSDEATGFLVAGARDQVKSPDPVLTAQQRADELHDIVSTTGSAFLGLTVGCARCHNHKFDPILQTDYYAMKAVFAGVQHGERRVGETDAASKAEADKLRPRLAEIDRELEQSEPFADVTVTGEKRRAAVSTKRNTERISPARATHLRFTIAKTNNGSEPCIDELEVFDPNGKNVALEAKLTSSGNYASDPKHQLAHLNDGKYGNSWSWISNTAGSGWVELEFAGTVDVARVVWGRDREEKFRDRTATEYVIELREGEGSWHPVAGSNDRGTAPGEAPGNIAKLETERSELEKRIAALTAPRTAYAGVFEKPGDTFRLQRGDPMQPKEKMAPGALSNFHGFQLAADTADRERRVTLANWIVSPQNPLTARVIVNRLWHYHFGSGIVDTPSDFGVNGGRPTHPELLDWLASELIEHGWSLKHIHRLILTSAAYAQGAAHNTAAMAVDGSNRLLWRFPNRRLEAEPLRDAILAVSGRLDQTMGGPGFDLFEPNSNYVKVYVSKTKFGAGDYRRMVYQAKPRAELDTIFGTFDCPDAAQVQPRRTVSTTPLQALNLLNSAFILDQSAAFAERVEREAAPTTAARVQRAYRLAFARPATPAEAAAAERFIAAQGLPAFCRALYNANEFVIIY
jgi:hypothetical protein